jgi:hypothetical protein
MNTNQFDDLLRDLPQASSRRGVLGGLAVLALTAFGLPSAVDAKKRRRKRKKNKKPKFNRFGCVNVGGFCKNSGQCCSGICQGKKRKKRCQGHNQSTCEGQNFCTGEFADCIATDEVSGVCAVTTGNASYCATTTVCFDCTKDADCVPTCGAGAACIVCDELCLSPGTACAGASASVCGD